MNNISLGFTAATHGASPAQVFSFLAAEIRDVFGKGTNTLYLEVLSSKCIMFLTVIVRTHAAFISIQKR